ncbi:hypothetical protein [Clostridium sp. DMHC 10]|nr:hypothetical protein [Clostridium sp. DMHC 10]
MDKVENELIRDDEDELALLNVNENYLIDDVYTFIVKMNKLNGFLKK